jgi:hypothetical protein
MTYIVTKIESHNGQYKVTAKDADTSKLKRRNIDSLTDDANEFKVGQRVTVVMVALQEEEN